MTENKMAAPNGSQNIGSIFTNEQSQERETGYLPSGLQLYAISCDAQFG